MKDPLYNYEPCHKCGGQGIFLGSDFDGESWHYDYECEDCEANWNVEFELKPVERYNDVG